MTSSLVGSEMCIRDSTLLFGLGTDPWRLMLQLPLAGLARMQRGETQLPCLLYTSDAADDM
eukprot:5103789-Prorocentrum_lima.AAC.1